jgi:hypothetical protein
LSFQKAAVDHRQQSLRCGRPNCEFLRRHRYRRDGNNHPGFGGCLGGAFCGLALSGEGQRFGQQVGGLRIGRRTDRKAFLVVPVFFFGDFRTVADLEKKGALKRDNEDIVLLSGIKT